MCFHHTMKSFISKKDQGNWIPYDMTNVAHFLPHRIIRSEGRFKNMQVKARDFLNQSEMNHQHFNWSLSQYSLILFSSTELTLWGIFYTQRTKQRFHIQAHRNPWRPFISIFLCDFLCDFFRMLKFSLFQKDKFTYYIYILFNVNINEITKYLFKYKNMIKLK